jgi:hypothetical protein
MTRCDCKPPSPGGFFFGCCMAPNRLPLFFFGSLEIYLNFFKKVRKSR